jgi:hypothetical protein
MFGTMFTFDALASSNKTVLEIGEKQAFDAIEAALAVHNALLDDVASNLATVSTRRSEVYGGNRKIKGEKVDQIGVVDAQKITAGATVDFPLDRLQYAVQWTFDAFDVLTGDELAAQFTAIEEGDVEDFRLDILKAIFQPTNYTTTDRFIDHTALNVKALINADGTEMPIGPRGATFDGATHNHYLADATTDQTTVLELIHTVTEHYERGRAQLFINKAQEALVRGFALFLPAPATNTVPSQTAARAVGELDLDILDDRYIGVLDQADVWIKPWMPAAYMFCFLIGPPKPVRIRRRRNGLRLVSRESTFPLRCERLENEYGTAIWERTNGAVLDTGSDTYRVPTLT